MNFHDTQYLNLLKQVQQNGKMRSDRTGTGTIGLFGLQGRFDLRQSFPLLTSKKVHWPSVVHELLWFIQGDTNIKYLNDNGVKIWNEWATEEGDLGPVYGAMWRSWPAPMIDPANGMVVSQGFIDQIEELMNNLRTKPFSRRHIVSGWNPALLPDESMSPNENAANGLQALPPCHTLFQFYVEELTLAEREAIHFGTLVGSKDEDFRHRVLDHAGVPRLGLSCQLYQRSADMFLGVPFNIASYSLLTYMVAHCVGMHPMSFVWSGGDCHIYSNHQEQVQTQLDRQRCEKLPQSPTLRIEGEHERLEDIRFEDIILEGYDPLPAIKAPIAV